jgi:glucose 1-dehydrogenase
MENWMMRGIAAWPNQDRATLEELPEPPPPSDQEVLCRTLELGICGTDREILASRRPALPPDSDFLVLGHECLGVIEQVGGEVREFQPGDLVVPVVRRPRPGHQRRTDFLAEGEFVERGIYHEHGFSLPRWLDRPEFLIPVPSTLRNLAVFAEPVAVVEKGIHEALLLQTARLGDNDPRWQKPRVLVTGLGPIAFAAILSCRRRGWSVTVYGRDPAESARARLAGSLGAQYARDTDWVTEPEDLERDGWDLLLECTGSDEVLVRTSLSLASCGVAVWLGSSRQPKARSLPFAAVMRNAVIGNHLHLGSVNAARRDFQAALETLAWVQEHHPQAGGRILTARLKLEESLEHFHERPPQGIKTVIDMS